ncbi:MAG: hypothetical protein sL5_09220 [Candidatus Mesenet longicola]|uniref:Uncharacterized protein n=1 Tax=Candidatus Mesenet longicola TaxID=1892558 RepID=A0A8J3MMG9_9RICK|nr:MAG: hypothetical protein sGL2_09870 [Candidatus Mesenet longicola]GHM59929.1 MAG: hypothetical protein sL5_09220 [Candidatus Mesenet longicola]
MHSASIINNMNDNQDIVMRLAQLDYLNDRAIQFVFGDKKRLSKLKNGLDILSILIKSGKFFNDYVIELIFGKNLDSIKNNLDIFEECLRIKNRDNRAHQDSINIELIKTVFSDRNILLRIKENKSIFKKILEHNKLNEDSIRAVFYDQECLDLIINNIDIFDMLLKLSHEHQFPCLVKNVFNNMQSFDKLRKHIDVLEKVLEITFSNDKAMYPYEGWIQDIFDNDEIFARIMEAPDVCCRLLEKLPASYLVMEVLGDQKFYTNIIENKWLLDELLVLNDGAGVLKRIFKDYSDDAEGHISRRLKSVDRNILYSILKAPNINTYDKSNIIRTILDNRSILSKIQNNQQVFNTILKSKNCGQYFIEFIFSDEERLGAFVKELSKAKSKDLSVVPTELVSVALSNVLMTQQTVEV